MIAGALIILAFVGGTFYGYWIANHTKKEEAPSQTEDTASDMARQWFNIMNYDGTERGQIGEDDADYT